MAQAMKLRYVVITSVNRDDLDDGGSRHFAQTVSEVRHALPEARVEVLTPDFCGDLDAVARVLESARTCSITIWKRSRGCTRACVPQANYRQSLDVLQFAKRYRAEALTKSGAMVGLGETEAEVHALLRDLRAADVDVATLGQYLQPTRRNCASPSTSRPPNLTHIATSVCRWDSKRSSAARWCAVPTWPTT
jgi:lipoic acid synthetase